MLGLREDPRIAPGEAAEIKRGVLAPVLGMDAGVRKVALEGDRLLESRTEAEEASRGAVRAVGADEDAGGVGVTRCGNADRVLIDGADSLAVVEVGARLGGAFGEKRIEAAALGHVGQRLTEAAVEALAEAEGDARAVDRPLDDGREVHVLDGRRAQGDAAAAGLVPREFLLVEHEDGGAAAGEHAGGSATRGTGAGDDDVVSVHARFSLAVRGAAPHRRSQWP